MSRRVSSRIASSHMLGRAGAGASPSVEVSAAAPASKRRRKDSSTASPHFDLKNGKHAPEHDDPKGRVGVLGTPKQLVSVTTPAETDVGSSSFSSSSVVMVQVPAGFSLAQAACRCGGAGSFHCGDRIFARYIFLRETKRSSMRMGAFGAFSAVRQWHGGSRAAPAGKCVTVGDTIQRALAMSIGVPPG